MIIRTIYMQKQPSCKKRCGPCIKDSMNKLWNPRWRPRSGCDGSIMAKFLIKKFSASRFAWIFVIKNFAIILPSQPLLGCHLRFHNLFMLFFLHGPHLFLQLGCFCVDKLYRQSNSLLYVRLKAPHTVWLHISYT